MFRSGFAGTFYLREKSELFRIYFLSPAQNNLPLKNLVRKYLWIAQEIIAGQRKPVV
jgi:hypothetical protein